MKEEERSSAFLIQNGYLDFCEDVEHEDAPCLQPPGLPNQP